MLHRFSNRQTAVDQAKRILERMAANDQTDLPTVLNGAASVDVAVSARQPWRVADRLGADELDRLLADWRNGTSKPTLARRYGISLSSVKRILRQHREPEVF